MVVKKNYSKAEVKVYENTIMPLLYQTSVLKGTDFTPGMTIDSKEGNFFIDNDEDY